MKTSQRWILFTLLIVSFIMAACTVAPKAPPKAAPAVLETVEGSTIKRVKLTEKAASRLGIQTDVVKESAATRVRVVGGTIVDSQALSSGGASIPVTGAGGAFVSVRLSEIDRSMLDQNRPVNVKLSGASQSSGSSEILAEPVGFENAGQDLNSPVFFRVSSIGATLHLGQSVLIEYHLAGSGSTKRSVPYSAIVYDLKGDTWVYTNPSPLVYFRQPVVVDYIDGDRAILKDGPSVGTQIVTVGVPELYGIDTGVDK